MRLSSYQLATLQPMLALLPLVLLLPAPGANTHPHFPAAVLPTLEHPNWEAALLQLQASLDVPGSLRPWGPLLGVGPGDPRLGLFRELGVEDVRGQEAIRRGQRGELERRPLGPFPGHPMETLHYQVGGEAEGEAGGERNEAQTSIAGGLRAYHRDKGCFAFRFGRR